MGRSHATQASEKKGTQEEENMDEIREAVAHVLAKIDRGEEEEER
jgi:hypothetical protein